MYNKYSAIKYLQIICKLLVFILFILIYSICMFAYHICQCVCVCVCVFNVFVNILMAQ